MHRPLTTTKVALSTVSVFFFHAVGTDRHLWLRGLWSFGLERRKYRQKRTPRNLFRKRRPFCTAKGCNKYLIMRGQQAKRIKKKKAHYVDISMIYVHWNLGSLCCGKTRQEDAGKSHARTHSTYTHTRTCPPFFSHQWLIVSAIHWPESQQ